MVKAAITEANEIELKYDIKEKYKKLKTSDLAKEEFGRKSYFKNLSLQESRTMFKYRCSMTQHVKMNQKKQRRIFCSVVEVRGVRNARHE